MELLILICRLSRRNPWCYNVGEVLPSARGYKRHFLLLAFDFRGSPFGGYQTFFE